MVKKWSPRSLYHMVTGENDIVEDILLYKVYDEHHHHWIPVLLENLFLVSLSYDHVLNWRRMKFGTSCAYVIDDLEWFVKFRYWLTYRWQLHIRDTCFSFLGEAPVCTETECK